MDQTGNEKLLSPEASEHAFRQKVGLGRGLAPEFVSTLGDHAYDALSNWLEANGVPQQIVDLAFDCIMLETCALGLEHGFISDNAASNLVDEIGPITQRIVDAGGVFHSHAGQTIPRENIIHWEPVQKGD
jgi:hypothetical protein